MEHDFVSLFDTICSLGSGSYPKHEGAIQERIDSFVPEDIATLIYTSGTTGQPKGAMVTHRNLVSNIKSAHQAIHITEADCTLTFLQRSNSFARTGGYAEMIAGGAEIYF